MVRMDPVVLFCLLDGTENNIVKAVNQASDTKPFYNDKRIV